MNRRTYLRLASVGIAGTAGCLAGPPRASDDAAGEPGTRSGTTGQSSQQDNQYGSIGDQSLPVPESELQRALGRDGIAAIVDPAFAPDWQGLELAVSGPQGFPITIQPRLEPEDRVVGVARDGRARAYPLSVLRWHEVVNDDFAGPLLVTYCPLCRSAVTAQRRADGEVTTFGVSGLLWRDNLVLYDEATDSRWSQLAATAIRGPLTGERLSLTPSTLTTWDAWQTAHPDTEVLRPPPESETVTTSTPRNYDFNPYSGYAESRGVGNRRRQTDGKRHPKTLVVGIAVDGQARAYPLEAVQSAGVVNDIVGDLPVVVTVADGQTLVAYERRVGGTPVRFESADDTVRADGSHWNPHTGRARDGPHEGTTLARANDVAPLYWFAWRESHPETDIYSA